ncbi:MAG: DUF421 domain-containing protein [Clostridia bacterium]|nr:DUF421 domain-containing protein [Clostridia bacterium]
MITILFRTVIIYILISILLRCMGKRQVGELELSDLVATLLISEVASLPIADSNVPLLNALIPLLLVLSFEIILTYLKTKFSPLKKLLEGKPSILIARGRLDQTELERMRISIEEFIGECRLQGYADLSDIDYAILEQDGQLSILPRAERQPLCAEDVRITVKDKGLSHPVILDGRVQDNHLSMLGLDRRWLEKECAKRGRQIKEVFLMTVDDGGGISMIGKEKKA